MLGTWITVNNKLHRCGTYHRFEKPRKFWDKRTIKPTKVMVIGIRTLSDGDINESGYGDDYEKYYEAKRWFKAFLVVKDMYTKPFYVEDWRVLDVDHS